MGDWSITKQIRTLAGLLIAALALMATVAFASTWRQGISIDRLNSAGQEALLINDIFEDLMEGRAAALAFRSSTTDGFVEEVGQNLVEAADVAAQLKNLLDDDHEAQAPLAAILRDLSAYRDVFDTTVQGRHLIVAEMKDLRVSGGEINTRLTDMIEEAASDFISTGLNRFVEAQSALLTSALWAERFFLSGEADAAREAGALIAVAREALEDAVDLVPAASKGAAIEQAKALLESYARSLSEVAALHAGQTANYLQLDTIGPRTAAEIETIVELLRADMDEISLTASALSRLALALVLTIAGISVAGGLIFALRVTRRVAADIGASVSAMERLAAGDLETEINGSGKDTETGKIARALVVFRDGAVAARAQAQREAAADAARRKAEEVAAADREKAAAETRLKEKHAREATIAELGASIGDVVEAAARGDFSQRIDRQFSEATLDAMVNSINTLLANVELGVGDTASALRKMANGDFSSGMSGDFRGAFRELQLCVNETITALSSLVVDIRSASETVGDQSTRMNEAAENLARRAEHQAASLEQTTAAMREIASSVSKGADEAAAAHQHADAAVTKADSAGREVADAVTAMQAIEAASTEIEEIVSVIEGIAFQTNLLALNASVEAARAGSAGKGFAVVATEVRDLAQRSADASQNIKGLIEKSSAKIEVGVRLVESTGTSLADVVETVRQMSNAMTEIANGARDQAAGVSEIQTAIGTLDELTQKNAQMAEQTRGDAQSLAAASGTMQSKMERFRVAEADRYATGLSSAA